VAAAFIGGPLTADVPGNVHDDLLAHGLIPDPYLGTAERDVQWVGRQDWCYTASLPHLDQPWERVDLVADGLDTAASLELDGQVLGQTRDQHRSYRFDVTALLVAQGYLPDAAVPSPSTTPAPSGDSSDRPNPTVRTSQSGGSGLRDGIDQADQADHETPSPELTITFESIYALAERVKAVTGPYPAPYDEPFPYVRKMASNFGWDWGPVITTAGIWRDIRLEAWKTARLARVRPQAYLTTPTGDTGEVKLEATIERTGSSAPVTLRAVLTCPDGSVVASAQANVVDRQVNLVLRPGTVQRWWPHGLGEQPLYNLEVTLNGPDGVLDSATRRIGFRHISLVTKGDAAGESFGFEIAGRPVFALGFNWIPDDLLVSRVGPERYRARLAEAAACGANLVRVWGGGLFEQDGFYEACDELGLMVWQDCPFACAAYPETPCYATEVEAELRDNVVRLMSHASLVLWNGCNESFLGYDEWGWPEILAGRGWGEAYYLELIPRVLAELDPGRPYWPGSPYSRQAGRKANDPAYGCHHSWTVWNQSDYSDYASLRPRFVAEFGWCGAPAYTTLLDAVGSDHLRPWDPVLMWHYKPIDGATKLRRAITEAFHEPTSFDAWHYVTQVRQARAAGFGLDYWRGLWPHCQGALVWQLNDCWPVISWAAVDSAGRRKPIWYAVRRSFAERLAVLEDSPEGYLLRLVNQSQTAWRANPLVRRLGLAQGEERFSWSVSQVVPPGEVVTLLAPPDLAPGTGQVGELGRGLGDDEFLLVEADFQAPDPATRRIIAQPDKRLALQEPRWTVELTWQDHSPGPDSVSGPLARVKVTALSVLRDLLLQPDRIGASGEAPLVTLLPGESFEWLLDGLHPDGFDPASLATPVIMDATWAELSARRQPSGE
jgi:beta-mannosidase